MVIASEVEERGNLVQASCPSTAEDDSSIVKGGYCGRQPAVEEAFGDCLDWVAWVWV